MLIKEEILSKYLSSQALVNFLSFFIVIALIILGNQFFLVISQSIKDGLYGFEIMPLVFLKFLRDLPFVISLSFCLAIIYTLNNLYKNSEIIIFTSAGVSDLKIAKAIFPLITIIMIFVSFLSFYFIPEIKKNIESLKNDAKSRPEYIFFKEGVFQNFGNDSRIFFSKKIESKENSGSQSLYDIFIYSEEEDKIILAKFGEKNLNTFSGDVFLDLINGKIYENLHNTFQTNPKVSNFNNLTIKIFDNPDDKNTHNIMNLSEFKKITDLFFSKKIEDKVEFFYRISIPMSLLIGSLFSVMISKTNPRSKKNFAIGFGLIFYISYYNVITYFKEIDIETMHQVIQYFLVSHFVFFIMFLILVLNRNNFFIKFKFL